MVLDRTGYDRGILNIINDTSKFKPLSSDPTLTQDGKIQRFLRDLRKKSQLEQEVYDAIYPRGSQPARIYGPLKIHKLRAANTTPPFHLIVSSIGTYNYNLGKALSNLLQPHIPSE